MQQAWADFLAFVPWEHSLTLTFDPKRRRFPAGRDLASREAFRWCNDVAYMVRRPIGWLYAVERGKGGLWHAHALIAGTGKANLTPALGIWGVRNGHAEYREVYASHRLLLYTTKEAAESGELVLSDTIESYLPMLRNIEVVGLHP